MANIRAFQACDASSILAARTKELMFKTLPEECFFCYNVTMSTETSPKSSIAWKYYLRFLWLIAIVFLGVIIYGLIDVQMEANRNPASGLAIVGVFIYVVVLAVYCGFIFLNRHIRKKIGHNEKASWRFLVISWLVIGLVVAISVFTIVQGAVAQDYYEKNVLPKEQACYEDYLNGKQASPHCTQ